MSPRLADIEVAELERWYRLASPPRQTVPPDTRAVTAFGFCLAFVVLVLIAQANGA